MSQKINQLIIQVKQHLNLGQNQSQNSIRQIENQIDQKGLEIRDIFSTNLDQVINHYTKYQEITTSQKRIEAICQSFTQRVLKAENLSKYDEEMIQRGEKSIIALKNKKAQFQNFRQNLRHLKKAAMSISQERYSNAIKQLNIYKQIQQKIDTPLKKTVKIFGDKIESHIINLINNFWSANKPKILEVGMHCYSKVQLSTHQKTNIYQAFFGRNSVSASRNSVIRRSSIIDESKGDAPLRFLKKIKNQQILQKFVLRINVQMNILKQTKALCKQMKEQQIFQNTINKEMRKQINQIAKETPCQNQQDLKNLLANYIGFLLYRRQIIAYFTLEGQDKVNFAQIYTLIGQQIKQLVRKPENSSQILKLKQILDIFHRVLQIVNLQDKSSQYCMVIGDLLKIYCALNFEQFETLITQHIISDNMMAYVASTEQQQKQIQQILQVRPPKGQPYRFTTLVNDVIQIFSQFYDKLVAFVKDSQLNKSQLHEYLGGLLQRIITVYGGQVLSKDQPLQIAQGEVNLDYCEKIFLHFSKQLEVKHQYMRMSEFGYKNKLESIVVELRKRIKQIVQQKINMMLMYHTKIWLPESINTQPNQFLVWMMEYLKQIILQLRKVNNTSDQALAISWVGHIADIYWWYFEQCKQFTLFTIYNLDVDLMFIYRFLSRNFPFYSNITDKLKPLSQFYAMMLTNNLQEVQDKQKRDIVYSHLDFYRLIPILSKYNRASNSNSKVRDLKKKDVQNLVAKLKIQYK